MFQPNTPSDYSYYFPDPEGHVVEAPGNNEDVGYVNDLSTVEHATVPMNFNYWVTGLEHDQTGENETTTLTPQLGPQRHTGSDNPATSSSQFPMDLTLAGAIGQPGFDQSWLQSVPTLLSGLAPVATTSNTTLLSAGDDVPVARPHFSLITLKGASDPYMEAHLAQLDVPQLKYYVMNITNISWNEAFTQGLYRRPTRLYCDTVVTMTNERQLAIDPDWQIEEGMLF